MLNENKKKVTYILKTQLMSD